VLAGAALAVALPAAVLALALERLVLAPLVGRLAAGYADLAPQSSAGQAAIALGGLALLGLVAAAWVARQATAAPPLRGLRDE
jgi:putative ABC transport system permease protein